MTHQDILSAIETAYSALISIPRDHECIKYHRKAIVELEDAIYHVNEVWVRVENFSVEPEEILVETVFSKMLGK
jgi:hypothetical protein